MEGCLLGLFAWNSLFGTAGAVVLCLHSYGSGHFLSDARIEACCHSFDLDHNSSYTGVLTSDCHQCTDIELHGSSVAVLQQSENSRVRATPVVLSEVWLPNRTQSKQIEGGLLLGSLRGHEVAPLGVKVKQTVVRLL